MIKNPHREIHTDAIKHASVMLYPKSAAAYDSNQSNWAFGIQWNTKAQPFPSRITLTCPARFCFHESGHSLTNHWWIPNYMTSIKARKEKEKEKEYTGIKKNKKNQWYAAAIMHDITKKIIASMKEDDYLIYSKDPRTQ